MNEIVLKKDEQIAINDVQFSGAFFMNLALVKYNKQPVMFVPNEDENANGISYRAVGYDDIRDREIADALESYIEAKQIEHIESCRMTLERAEVARDDAIKALMAIGELTSREIFAYVSFKKFVVEIIIKMLDAVSVVLGKVKLG